MSSRDSTDRQKVARPARPHRPRPPVTRVPSSPTVLWRTVDVEALSAAAGNRAVASVLAPTVQRTPEADVIAALDDTTMKISTPDTKKAWGVLNSLSMTEMLATMAALEARGRFAALAADMSAARRYNVPRLTVGMVAMRLRQSGRAGEPAELQKLADQIATAGIGGQVAEVEVFLKLPAASLTDQRAGVGEPDPSKLGDINAALNPAAGAAGTAWDGAGSTPTAIANRKKLKDGLLAALGRHLKAVMPRMRKRAKAPKLPMTAYEGAGKEAKRVVDAAMGGSSGAAALTGGQAGVRSSFSFAAGTNLVDLTDPANYTPNPEDVSDWIAHTDPAAAAVSASHHFESSRTPAEKSFLKSEVIQPFVAANSRDLAVYDVHGFAITLEPGVVAIEPNLLGDTKAPPGGGPSPAERLARWGEWETLVHEYIHTLEHPAFGEASQGRRVMKEGFCELFTKEVLTAQIPKAQGGDVTLQTGVEGTDPSGKPWPGFSASLVRNYSPGLYAAYLAGAEKIVAATSLAAAKSAFFQGHVELIGLQPDGDMAAPVAPGSGELLPVPAGIATVFALSVITNASSSAILAANPGLPAAGPLPASVRVPGARLHTLVAAEELRPTGGVMATKVEGPPEIGVQHGCPPAAITRANPGFDWSKAKAGDHVIVPVH